MHFVFVVNGRQDKSFIAAAIKRQLSEIPTFTDYEIYLTKAKRDATKFVESYDMSGKDDVCFVACGGDGTINEVATGVMSNPNKVLAVMAYGTGNDFVKYYPSADFKNVGALLAGNIINIDILKVNDNYSINVCNIGFDAAVARIANSISRRRNGTSVYRRALTRAFLFNRHNDVSISIGEEVLNDAPILLSTFANCKCLGGEFYCAPRAVNDDGYMEVCVIKPMNVFKLMRCIEVYKTGHHIDNPDYADYVIYRKAKKVTVSADHEFEACVDGEILIDATFNIEVLPSAIKLVLPQSSGNIRKNNI